MADIMPGPALFQTSSIPADSAPVSLEEAKAHLRISTSDDDAVIAGYIRAATQIAEGYIGQPLIQQDCIDILSARENDGGLYRGQWQRLAQSPVAAIIGIDELSAAGTASPLPISDYAIDIDAGGTGWVRIMRNGTPSTMHASRMRISYHAGIAGNASAVPDAIRIGVLHMAAHLFANRDAIADPPAAIVALWRPYRRMRLI